MNNPVIIRPRERENDEEILSSSPPDKVSLYIIYICYCYCYYL